MSTHQLRPLAWLAAAVMIVPSLVAESLQERIAARRTAIEAKARSEAAATAAANINPELDPEMWRIARFGIPTKRLFGIAIAGSGDSRFYGRAPRSAWQDSYAEGQNVYFYDYSDGLLHLAGRGRLVKCHVERDGVDIEAALRSFRWAVPEIKPIPNQGRWAVVLKLVPSKNPGNERWYMSTKLKGPDTLGWGLDQQECFARGIVWVGMTEHAMYALCGPPNDTIQGGGETRLVYQRINGSQRIQIRDGKVSGLDPAKPISFEFEALANQGAP